MFEMTNELGQIHFSKNVIYRICSDAARSTGDARLQNYKGRYTTKKPGILNPFSQNEEDEDAVEFVEAGDTLRLTLYVVVRFGVSISATAEAIIDHVYYEIEALFGIPPAHVTVIVTGTVSKTIAKRHIEFSR